MSRLRTQPRARTEAATRFRACQSHRVLSRKDCTAQECSVPMEVDTKPAADQAESTKCCAMLPMLLRDKGRQLGGSCTVG